MYVFGVDGFTFNIALDIKCWWTNVYFLNVLTFFLGKYICHFLLTVEMCYEVYNITWSCVCEYWDTPTIHNYVKFLYFIRQNAFLTKGMFDCLALIWRHDDTPYLRYTTWCDRAEGLLLYQHGLEFVRSDNI